MASKLLLEYFTLHIYFLLDSTFALLLDKYMGKLPSKGEEGRFFQKLRWDELDTHVVNTGRSVVFPLTSVILLKKKNDKSM